MRRWIRSRSNFQSVKIGGNARFGRILLRIYAPFLRNLSFRGDIPQRRFMVTGEAMQPRLAEALRRIFDEHDLDKDGVLNSEELRKFEVHCTTLEFLK